MLLRLLSSIFVVALISSASAQQTYSPQTRQQLTDYNNNNIKQNTNKATSSQILQDMNNQFIPSFGAVAEKNTWLKPQTFNVPVGVDSGGTGGTNAGDARTGIGAAAADGSTSFTATGATASASAADRATCRGLCFDARLDFTPKFVCDGLADDTAAMNAMKAAINATVTGVKVQFVGPKLCLIQPATYTFTVPITMDFVNGGGFMLPASTPITGGFTLLNFTTTSGLVELNNPLIDFNHNAVTLTHFLYGISIADGLTHHALGTGVNWRIKGLRCKNGGTNNGIVIGCLFAHNFNVGTLDDEQAIFDATQQSNTKAALFSDFGILNVHKIVGVNTNVSVLETDGASYERFSVDDVKTSGVGYGAGVADETSGAAVDNSNKLSTITNVSCDGTGATVNGFVLADTSNNFVPCVESGFSGVNISNIVSNNTCGPGVKIYGKDVVTNVNAKNYGTCKFVAAPVVLTNPFTTTNNAFVVTVNWPAHGFTSGKSVSFSGATPVGGLTINGSYVITTIVDADNFTIRASSQATSTAGPGGGSVTGQLIADFWADTYESAISTVTPSLYPHGAEGSYIANNYGACDGAVANAHCTFGFYAASGLTGTIDVGANSFASLPTPYLLSSPNSVSAPGVRSTTVLGSACYKVAALPASGNSAGDRACVTDATSCSLNGALTGGGSTFCPVIHNGTAFVGG